MCSALEVIPNRSQTQLMNRAHCNCMVLRTVRDLEDGCYTNKMTSYYEAEQTQINGAKSASTILTDLILWIIKYPLERKILIGLQSCE